MNDKAIEQEIQAKRLTAPRITPDDIEANITSEFYFTAADGVEGSSGHRPNGVRAGTALSLLTFCVLVLRNGFTVTGESACASPENFDAEIGRKIARQNAVAKIWPLMGYELRTQLSRPVLTEGDALADLNGTRRPDNHAATNEPEDDKSDNRLMTFGQALEVLKHGLKVARLGWNGKGMWLVMVPGSHVSLHDGTPYHAALNTGKYGQSHVTINPHIDMKTATGEMQPGWLASQTDMLAEDWVIVE